MKLHTCDSVGGGYARGGVENLFHAHVVLLQSMVGVCVFVCVWECWMIRYNVVHEKR